MAAIITIVRRSADVVEFQPPEITIPSGEVVVFRNHDPREQHWITRQGADRSLWFKHPLAPFVPGRPADVSDELLLDERVTPYVCALHARESGVINVEAR